MFQQGRFDVEFRHRQTILVWMRRDYASMIRRADRAPETEFSLARDPPLAQLMIR